MAKQTKSYSLETDLIDLIQKVQKEKKLSSASAALERILIDFQYRSNNNNLIPRLKPSINESKKDNVENDAISKTIQSAYDDMQP